MKGSEFPFGQIENHSVDQSRMLVKKRIHYRNSGDHALIKQKIDKLKTLTHKNCINLRQTDQSTHGYVDLYYAYVPLTLD